MAHHPRITEIAMNPARALLLSALLFAAGCKVNPIVPLPNDRPTADARLVGPSGPIDETVDGGAAALKFDFTPGTPIDLTLDGTGSRDTDGKIVKYQWLSATLAPDGGIPLGEHNTELRWFPEGANGAWPDDVAQPHVQLNSEGVFAFSLWVTDNDGSVSTPDTIKITVGTAVDPAITECANNVIPSVQPACAQCVCGLSEMCRGAVVMSACNEDCWGLIQCIGAMCPDFAAMAAMMDFSCVTTNCADFLGGATAAMAAGMCVTMCPNDCTSMPAMMMP